MLCVAHWSAGNGRSIAAVRKVDTCDCMDCTARSTPDTPSEAGTVISRFHSTVADWGRLLIEWETMSAGAVLLGWLFMARKQEMLDRRDARRAEVWRRCVGGVEEVWRRCEFGGVSSAV